MSNSQTGNDYCVGLRGNYGATNRRFLTNTVPFSHEATGPNHCVDADRGPSLWPEFLIAPAGAYGILPLQSERSSAWLEHLVWDQDVAGSNPVAPTSLFTGKLDFSCRRR